LDDASNNNLTISTSQTKILAIKGKESWAKIAVNNNIFKQVTNFISVLNWAVTEICI
jgi:hypothetical protein